jgi:DNA polymerase III subunit epsilon
MVRGAEKNGVVMTDEHRCLGMVANALELPIEWVPKPDDDNDPTGQVTAGSSVCFTGSFVDLNGNPISKSALKELAVSSGLEVFAICHQVKV